jgi:hypothetical protein
MCTVGAFDVNYPEKEKRERREKERRRDERGASQCKS